MHGRWCAFGRTAGKATQSKWINSLGIYFIIITGELTVSGSPSQNKDLRFYTNQKKMNKEGFITEILRQKMG